jgi:hypothetical protein
MGHLGRLKEQYRELAGRLQTGPVALAEPTDAHAWDGWREILEILYTPEEAALAARMPIRPASLEALASRTGESPDALRPRLEAMADKGLVMDLVHPRSGKTTWFLSPPVVGFFEFSLMRARDSIPKKRMAEALHAYTHGDEAFARDVFGGATTIGRALVHEPALAEDPLPEVLDWQRASATAATRWSTSARPATRPWTTACPSTAAPTSSSGASSVAPSIDPRRSRSSRGRASRGSCRSRTTSGTGPPSCATAAAAAASSSRRPTAGGCAP